MCIPDILHPTSKVCGEYYKPILGICLALSSNVTGTEQNHRC